MARKKKRNKSAAIRTVLSDNPTAPAKEVVEMLALKGVKVRASDVYNVRSTMPQGAAPKQSALQVVNQVKSLASEAGGLKSLKQLVDALAE